MFQMAFGDSQESGEVVEKEDKSDMSWMKPLALFSEKKLVNLCAPMVRYSKLPFRTLVRKYQCDIAYTPMIVSNCFVCSQKARDSDFATCKGDRPLITQFAASNATDLADAAEIVANYSDGVDLNCGCPQRWAIQEGYGACLIKKPELVKDMVTQVRNRVSVDENFTVSIKIRIHKDLRETVDLCQKAEKAGVSWIAVHGRTVDQRCEPVNVEALRLVKDSLTVPVIANGDIRSVEDAKRIQEVTGVDGVMAARGILQNPAMYAGYDATPVQCVRDWLDIALSQGLSFTTFHHHLMYMLEKVMSRSERRLFNSLSSITAVLDYLREYYGIG
ncbi:tRNA-dihydrouridine(20a/20b) synthase [NAD(P)+]-like [Lingula anatina]|uniref:tRNA-dihydrouridine synthase n=1 Tax=Lingula anatina TaxID=7574 RepID=A0A1S3IMZ1_LINAN|nr:tRNA-dihydrouridine(20a/20b) synthase [NAD(P)+]-like [Lingula anatina]|eukprot:XP_013399266.1 tRNA-dihydrouridine(20a/20b) synthase [NAD(P)+]-like [Lingula anatina]